MKSNSMWTYNSGRIIQALDRWKILWDDHLKKVGPEFARTGFFKNSLEFWQLTKLIIKTSGSTGQIVLDKPAEIDIDSMTAINALMTKFQGVSIS